RSRVPVHVSDQPVHRGPAHLRIRLYHGTEAWGQVRPQSDAIKACDTEIVWNPKAAFVSGAHCAHCKKVVRAHQGGRAIAPAQGVCDFADRGFHEGHLDEREGVEPEAFHGQAEPRKTLLCAVRCTEAATDHGDALVTHVHEALYDLIHGVFPGDRNTGVSGMTVVYQNVGHALRFQSRDSFG